MVYIGVSGRFLVNIDALNMAESVGNVVRHKKAPVVVRDKSGYVIRYVPVISGQSIAHGYQELLVSVARKYGLSVCPLCAEGVFVKHGADEIIKRIAEKYGKAYARELLNLSKATSKKGSQEDFVEKFEEKVISNCYVEDVGGFLYPGKIPVKRTSRFMTGYMVPSLKYITAVGVEAQMHVRHDPRSAAGRAGEETGQAIYYVETASALYTVTMGLDLDYVGCYASASGGWRELADARKRREAAVTALAMLVEGMLWGAKKSRFMPSAVPESLVVTVSHPFPFNPTPGHRDDYIVDTIRRAKGFLEAAKNASSEAFIEVYYYMSADSAALKPEAGAKAVETAAQAVLAALKHVDKAKCG